MNGRQTIESMKGIDDVVLAHKWEIEVLSIEWFIYWHEAKSLQMGILIKGAVTAG